MAYTPEQLRAVLVRSRARKFAEAVKASNMAVKIPDETADWLKDEEVPQFFEHLRSFGLQSRADRLWERTTS